MVIHPPNSLFFSFQNQKPKNVQGSKIALFIIGVNPHQAVEMLFFSPLS